MANRILRDWTASYSIDALSEGAETFFTRLIMKADDYGCYYGDAKLLNSTLFPLRDYSNDKVLKWRNECVLSKVIILYKVDGREFLSIPNFGQRLRTMNSKFPKPTETTEPSIDSGVPTIDSNQPLETKRNRNEEEDETETKVLADETPPLTVWPSFEDFWQKYNKKIDRPKCEKKWKKIKQRAREEIMQHSDEYIPSTPDEKFRKNPQTYLNNESWKDQIIKPPDPHGKQRITADGSNQRVSSYNIKI